MNPGFSRRTSWPFQWKIRSAFVGYLIQLAINILVQLFNRVYWVHLLKFWETTFFGFTYFFKIKLKAPVHFEAKKKKLFHIFFFLPNTNTTNYFFHSMFFGLLMGYQTGTLKNFGRQHFYSLKFVSFFRSLEFFFLLNQIKSNQTLKICKYLFHYYYFLG